MVRGTRRSSKIGLDTSKCLGKPNGMDFKCHGSFRGKAKTCKISQMSENVIRLNGYSENFKVSETPEKGHIQETASRTDDYQEACALSVKRSTRKGKNSKNAKKNSQVLVISDQDHKRKTDEEEEEWNISLKETKEKMKNKRKCSIDDDSENSTTTVETRSPPPLPPSSTDFDVPDDAVGSLFEVYCFLRLFSKTIFLSPFTLKEFLDALKFSSPNALLDSVHLTLLQTLRTHLQRMALDDSSAAEKILRSQNWKMLDAITWPIFLADYLAIRELDQVHGQMINVRFFDQEYYSASVSTKLSILQFLCDEVMEVGAIKAEIYRRVRRQEANQNPKSFPTSSKVEDPNDSEWLPKDKEEQDKRSDTSNSKDKRDVIFEMPEYMNGSSKSIEILETKNDPNEEECSLCGMDGDILLCDGCPATYHCRCVGVLKTLLPEQEWYCPECSTSKNSQECGDFQGLQGAEIISFDSYGRLYFSACGYVLVLDSTRNSSVQYKYYNHGDVAKVLLTLTFDMASIELQNALRNFSEVADSHNTDSINQKCKNRAMTKSRNCSLEISKKNGFKKSKNEHASLLSNNYVNKYALGSVAASMAANLAMAGTNLGEAQISSKKMLSVKMAEAVEVLPTVAMPFFWPFSDNTIIQLLNERCGWCCSCKMASKYSKPCLLGMASGNWIAKNERRRTTPFPEMHRDIHFQALIGYILCIENQLQNHLQGPWKNPYHREFWRKAVEEATTIVEIKAYLLELEQSIKEIAFTKAWFEPLSAVSTEESCNCLSEAFKKGQPSRSLKKLISSVKDVVCENLLPASMDAKLFGVNWWRGRKSSSQAFTWRHLPSKLARQCGRQAGLKTIPAIFYRKCYKNGRRNKRCKWFVSVGLTKSIPELALQVRSLDASMRIGHCNR